MNDDQLNKAITVLKKSIDVNQNCTRAYKLLFELNMESNKDLSYDYLLSLVKINPEFLLISSDDILKLSSNHQDNNLDKKIYDMILNYSNPNLFSPNLMNLCSIIIIVIHQMSMSQKLMIIFLQRSMILCI